MPLVETIDLSAAYGRAPRGRRRERYRREKVETALSTIVHDLGPRLTPASQTFAITDQLVYAARLEGLEEVGQTPFDTCHVAAS